MNKKNLILIFFLLIFQTTVFAADKPRKDITFDFTLNYKINKAGNVSEHEMKNLLHITGDKWHVAGKFQSNKGEDVVLFLVKQVARRNNKFTFAFMIVDSDSKNTYITEPRMTVMAGLPDQLVITGDGRVITLNALVRLNEGGVTKVLQK